MDYLKFVPLAAAVSLGSCVTSPVTLLDPDTGTYLVAVHTFYGLTSKAALLERATGQADEFCARDGRVAQLKNRVATGTPGVTNLSADVAFTCAAKP